MIKMNFEDTGSGLAGKRFLPEFSRMASNSHFLTTTNVYDNLLELERERTLRTLWITAPGDLRHGRFS